jgi:hypothetical protein
MLMDKVRVFWTKDFTLEEAINKEEKQHEYLYMVFAENELKYIGMAFDGYLGDRLSNHEVIRVIKDDYPEDSIKIRTGNISGFKRVTRQLVEDVEAVLINYYNPQYNIQSTDIYWGRDIQITNQGTFRPLHKVIKYKGEECGHEG